MNLINQCIVETRSQIQSYLYSVFGGGRISLKKLMELFMDVLLFTMMEKVVNVLQLICVL